MAEGVQGQRVSTLATVDSGKVVTAANSNKSGLIHDWGVNAEPLPKTCVVRLGITNPGSTDGYDLNVRAKFAGATGAANWASAGEGQSLGNFYSAVAGADLARTRLLVVPVLNRYMRLEYDNNNGSDNLTVSAVFGRRNDSFANRGIS